MPLDRTHEFLAAAEGVSSPGTTHTVGRPYQRTNKSSSSSRDNEFNSKASEIQLILSATAFKLQHLSKLAKQRGIYNDKTSEIQELTYDIKQSLTESTKKVDIIEENFRKRTNITSQEQAHYTSMTTILRTRLIDMTKDFKDTLLLRTENMKRQDRRRNMYTFDSSNNEDANDLESGGQRTTLLREMGSTYSQSRAEAVENVQKVIGDLALIFQKVATLITHQDEMIQRIDADIDTSVVNIREGQSELLNYFNRISSNRSLIFKVFIILILFIIFFVLFLS